MIDRNGKRGPSRLLEAVEAAREARRAGRTAGHPRGGPVIGATGRRSHRALRILVHRRDGTACLVEAVRQGSNDEWDISVYRATAGQRVGEYTLMRTRFAGREIAGEHIGRIADYLYRVGPRGPLEKP